MRGKLVYTYLLFFLLRLFTSVLPVGRGRTIAFDDTTPYFAISGHRLLQPLLTHVSLDDLLPGCPWPAGRSSAIDLLELRSLLDPVIFVSPKMMTKPSESSFLRTFV